MDISSEDFTDDEGVMKKCFAVTLPEDFDPTKCPMTGEEFVQFAMYEAKQCKATVIADINGVKLKEPSPLLLPSGHDYLPVSLPLSWKNEKLYEFARFRKCIQKQIGTQLEYADFKEEYWSGRLTREPTFSEAIKLDAYNQQQILEMISKELQYVQSGTTMGDTTSCWIYTILSLLQIPLDPSLHGTLRDLSKKCSKIRHNLGTHTKVDDPLHLFVCIIGIFYEQYDLADDYIE